jgi:hypothetical protein
MWDSDPVPSLIPTHRLMKEGNAYWEKGGLRNVPALVQPLPPLPRDGVPQRGPEVQPAMASGLGPPGPDSPPWNATLEP